MVETLADGDPGRAPAALRADIRRFYATPSLGAGEGRKARALDEALARLDIGGRSAR